MRRFIAVFTLLVLLVPTALYADVFDDLMDDVNDIERQLERDEEQAANDIVDEDYESSSDLFPAVEGGSVTPDTPLSDTYVGVRVDGFEIVFTDVPLTEWFAPFVRDVALRQIVVGYLDKDGFPRNLFGPDDSVTIEQLAKIAVEAAQLDQSKCPNEPINKVAAESWSAGYIACAEFHRWLIYSDGAVDPTRPANRAEVVATLLQAFGRNFEPATGEIFKDVSNTMFLRDPIETAANDGLVSGTTDENGKLTGFFHPFDDVNRAEIAKMTSLAIDLYGI